MKTRMKLAVLLGVLTLASWLGTPRQALAYPLCDGLHGTYCSAPGSKTPCTTSVDAPAGN